MSIMPMPGRYPYPFPNPFPTEEKLPELGFWGTVVLVVAAGVAIVLSGVAADK